MKQTYLLTLWGLEQLCHGRNSVRGLERSSRCGRRISCYRGYWFSGWSWGGTWRKIYNTLLLNTRWSNFTTEPPESTLYMVDLLFQQSSVSAFLCRQGQPVLTLITWLVRAWVWCSSAAGPSCHVQKRLNNLDLEHTILLPQVQHPYDLTLHWRKKRPDVKEKE